jgi:Domain of unknown function (DUF4357)
MNKQIPFTLHIFVADGDPDGLRLVERSNWNGKAVMFPQTFYTTVRNRPEFNQPGVYLLLGSHPEGEGDKLYIGEGDPVRPRFEDHFANKDWWTQAVFFVAGLGQLNKAHVEYLEAQLYSRASAAKRTTLDNSNKPSEPTLSEADRADMYVFLQNILGILPVLGIHAFEQSPGMAAKGERSILTCRGRGVTATGYESSQGFVVRAGSYASNDEVPSLVEHFDNVCQLRAKLTKSGVLVPEGNKLRFTIDYTFNSPSLAAGVVLARSANGRVDWKDSTGKTLKELQEAQAEN